MLQHAHTLPWNKQVQPIVRSPPSLSSKSSNMAIQSKAAKQTAGQSNQDIPFEEFLAVVPTSNISDVSEGYVDDTKLPTQQEDADPADDDDEETSIAAARTGGGDDGGDGANGTNNGTAMEEGSDEHFVLADDSETEGGADPPQKKGQPAKKATGGKDALPIRSIAKDALPSRSIAKTKPARKKKGAGRAKKNRTRTSTSRGQGGRTRGGGGRPSSPATTAAS